jgi:hypothetical protein
MPDLTQELAHLAQADDHIAHAESCVTRQEILVARMRSHGHSGQAEEAMLGRSQAALATFNRHRAEIVAAINRLAPAADE